MDLDGSILRAGALILRVLRPRGVLPLETLRRKLRDHIVDDTDRVLGCALNLLYTLGRIEYHPVNDTLEYRAETARAD